MIIYFFHNAVICLNYDRFKDNNILICLNKIILFTVVKNTQRVFQLRNTS